MVTRIGLVLGQCRTGNAHQSGTPFMFWDMNSNQPPRFTDVDTVTNTRYTINTYGKEIRQKNNIFSNQQKLSKLLSHPIFLLWCRDNDVVPNFLCITHHVKTCSAKLILPRASMVLHCERIKQTRRTLNTLSVKVYHLHLELAHSVSREDFEHMDLISFNQSFTAYDISTTIQTRKFKNLSTRQSLKPANAPCTVINLSDFPFTPDDQSVLCPLPVSPASHSRIKSFVFASYFFIARLWTLPALRLSSLEGRHVSDVSLAAPNASWPKRTGLICSSYSDNQNISIRRSLTAKQLMYCTKFS